MFPPSIQTLRFAILIPLFIGGSLKADVFNLNAGTSMNWENAGTWTKISGAGAQTFPGASDSVSISGAGTSTIVIGNNITVGGMEYGSGVSRTITMRPTGSNLTRALTVSGDVAMNGNGTWTFYNADQATNVLMNVNVGGNVSVSAGTLEFGRLSTGAALQSLAISGTTSVSGGILAMSLVTNSTNGALSMSGGTFYVGSGTAVGGNRTISFTSLSGNAGTIDERVAGPAVANTLSITGSSTTSFAGTITDAGGTGTLAFLKGGTGTQTLAGTNAYNGGTTVAGGVLIAASNKALGNGDVTVNGGQLSLNGSTVQTLTLGTGADFGMSSGTLLLNYASTSSYDQIVGTVGGVLTLSGGIIDLGNSGWDYSQTYNIFTGFGSGSVAGLSYANYDSVNWQANINNNGVLSFSAVPEPSTYLLAVLGCGFFLLARRRGKRIA